MNDAPRPHLTRSVEDYLKAVYSLTEREESASTSALAEALDVQPASVTGMVKRLAECGYLEHARYHGAKLTESGSREALRIIRRHRILETYLSTHLGYSWDDVHQEAERLEHAASDALIDRMAKDARAAAFFRGKGRVLVKARRMGGERLCVGGGESEKIEKIDKFLEDK